MDDHHQFLLLFVIILFIPSNISNDSSLILNGITPGVGTPETYDEDEKFNTNK